MASLYKRASPSQVRILRIVEGAVKNAADAHPELDIRPHHRRSIAKRAAGTLTAQWPEVLAQASRPGSETGAPVSLITGRRRASDFDMAFARRALRLAKHPPFRALISEIARPIRGLKETGQSERAQALIDVLKVIHYLLLARLSGQPFPAEHGLGVRAISEQGNPATDEPPHYQSEGG